MGRLTKYEEDRSCCETCSFHKHDTHYDSLLGMCEREEEEEIHLLDSDGVFWGSDVGSTRLKTSQMFLINIALQSSYFLVIFL